MLTATFFVFFFLTLLNLHNTISTAFGVCSFWFIQVVIAFSFPIKVHIYDFLIATVWILSQDVLDDCNSHSSQ